MEIFSILLETLLKWFEQIPVSFSMTVLVGVVLFLVRRLTSVEEKIGSEIKNVREQQVIMRQEYYEQSAELKAAIERLSKDLRDEIKKQEEAQVESYKLALRTAITNERFPNYYRRDLYRIYQAVGGNSFIDGYVRDMLQEEGGNE